MGQFHGEGRYIRGGGRRRGGVSSSRTEQLGGHTSTNVRVVELNWRLKRLQAGSTFTTHTQIAAAAAAAAAAVVVVVVDL